jgi:hypothetical protein
MKLNQRQFLCSSVIQYDQDEVQSTTNCQSITKTHLQFMLKISTICVGNNTLEATTEILLVRNYTLDISIMLFNDIAIYINTCTNTQAHAYTS